MNRVAPLLGLLALAGGCVDQRLFPDDPDWVSWEDAPTTERVPVRIATWNVQGLGAVGSAEFEAAARVLGRLDADVVGLNEVDEQEAAALAQLGADLGYSVVVPPDDQPFGSIGNAILSRLPSTAVQQPDGADLSGDASAADLTRLPVVFTTRVPGTDRELTVVVQHWKSGFEPGDVFRRAVDGWRTTQASQLGADSDYLIVMGDVNAEEDEVGADTPWTSVPSDVPSDYRLGADLQALLQGDGLPNDPYATLDLRGLEPLDLAQRDGSLATRPTSGRRIDRVFADGAVRSSSVRGEVYDSADDTVDQPGLADGGERLDATDVARASDHLPVLIEFRVRTD